MQAPLHAKSDPLILIVALVLVAGIGLIFWLAFDAVRPRPLPAAIARANLRDDCPVPKPGEKLVIYAEMRAGKLDLACHTIRPFTPMREKP